MGNFIESTKEASKGGFQNIKAVRGLVINVDVVDPPATWKDATKKQFKIWLDDAAIIERFDPSDDFELKENKFEFQYPYAEPGKKPSAVGPYMRCLVAVLEAVGKKPSELIGQVVTFRKTPTDAGFDSKNKETGEKKKVVYDQYFVPVEDEGAANINTLAYMKEGLKGKNIKAALRWLIMDDRAKQLPEFKDALNDGSLATKVGLVLVNETFEEPKVAESNS